MKSVCVTPLCRRWLLACLFLPWVTLPLQAAGLAAYKQQPFHSNDLADIIVYASIRKVALSTYLDLGSKEFVCDSTKIVETVNVSTLPPNVKNEQAVAEVRKSYEEMGTFAARYKKAGTVLKPYIDQFASALKRFDVGDVLVDGKWLSRAEYTEVLRKEEKVKEEARQAALLQQKKWEEEKAKAALFASEQRSKGLEKYGEKWLPKDEVAALVERDRQNQMAWETVRAKSVSQMSYSVFQVIKEGILVEPHSGSLMQGGLNVELVLLRGATKGTAAEGDLYCDDVFWCGTFSYTTKGGRDKTVHVYSLNKDEAIASVKQTLFGTESQPKRPASPSSNAPVTASSPLDGASSTGSGFFVGNSGYFVTNAHVVDAASTVGIYYQDKIWPAKVLNVSKVADLALLKTDNPVVGLALAEGAVDLATDVFAIGFPNPDIQGIEVKVTKGVISSLRGLDSDDTRFQIDAAIQPGNSGGPLCDASGHVVGVIVSTLNAVRMAKATGNVPQNVNYAIKASELSAFLRARSVQIDQKPATSGLAPGAGVKTAVACVGLVIVKE